MACRDGEFPGWCAGFGIWQGKQRSFVYVFSKKWVGLLNLRCFPYLCVMNTNAQPLSNGSGNELPLARFGGDIVVVDTPESLRQAAVEIARLPIVGFDTESRPCFKRGESHAVALIQFASDQKAWLVRTCKLGFGDPIIALLESGTPLKVGASLRDDNLRLHQSASFAPKGFFELQTVMQRMGFEERSVRKMSERLLGWRVAKRQQLSNWENDTLTEAQQCYAATDAWLCLQLYCLPLVQEYLRGGGATISKG